MELVLEFNNNFQIARPVVYHRNEVVLQSCAFADKSALIQVILINIVLSSACFFVPTLLKEFLSIPIKAHTHSLVAEEIVFWVCKAEMNLKCVDIEVIESLGEQAEAFIIDRISLRVYFVSRELRVKHVSCNRIDFHEALLDADFSRIRVFVQGLLHQLFSRNNTCCSVV